MTAEDENMLTRVADEETAFADACALLSADVLPCRAQHCRQLYLPNDSQAAGIDANADAETIDNVIALFCTENLSTEEE
jgi:hypothetical protein